MKSRVHLLRLGSIVLCAALAATSPCVGQTFVYAEDSNPATGTSNAFPFGQTNGFSSIHFYTAKQLHAAGVAPYQQLTDFSMAPFTTGTYNAPQAQIHVGHVNGTPLPGAWTTTLDLPSIVHDLTFGPYTFPYTANTWTSMPGFAASNFFWDGVRDIALFMTTGPAVTGQFNIHRSATNFRISLAVFGATTQTPTSTGYFAMKARLTFSGNPPTQNTPEATFTLNGATGLSSLDGNDTLSFGISSPTAAGQLYVLALSGGLTGGHFPLTGQSFDLGNAAFGFSDVFMVGPGVVVPLLTGPITFFSVLDGFGVSNFSIPLPCFLGIPQTYMQAIILDPSHPDGVRTTGVPSFELKPDCRYPFAGTFPSAIPDTNTPQSFNVTVPPGLTITDLDLVLDLVHTNYTDLTITLSQAGGPSLVLKDATTVDISDLQGRYRFTDEALMTLDQAALLSGTTMSDGAYLGDFPMSTWDGLDAGGVWTVTITDTLVGSAGTLSGAALVFNGLQ